MASMLKVNDDGDNDNDKEPLINEILSNKCPIPIKLI